MMVPDSTPCGATHDGLAVYRCGDRTLNGVEMLCPRCQRIRDAEWMAEAGSHQYRIIRARKDRVWGSV